MLNDSIRVFLTVVEKKSFSKAAKALFLTQPAVSFQIQMLEEYYGTRLFDRVSRNIILTEAGHLLLKYACLLYTSVSSCQSPLSNHKICSFPSGGSLLQTQDCRNWQRLV